MKKTFKFCMALLAISTVVMAQPKLSQDIKVSIGKPYKVIDGSVKEYFYDGKESAIAIKKDGEKLFIQKFNAKTMDEVSRKEYLDFQQGSRFQDIIQVGDKLFYVFAVMNKKEKADYVYAREVSMSEGTFMPEKLLFKTTKEVTSVSFSGTSIFNMSTSQYEVYSSFDNSKIMFRYRLRPLERDDAKNFDIIGYQVFTSSLDKQWGGEVKMPYTEKQINNLAYAVGKNGTVQTLVYVNTSQTMEMITVTPESVLSTNKIGVTENTMVTKIFLKEDIDGGFTASGFYANGIETKVTWNGSTNKSLNVNGLLRFKVSGKGEFVNFKFYEFSIDLINQYESERAREKNEKREDSGKLGINDLVMTDVVTNLDGSTTLVGEQQYIVRNNNSMGGFGSTGSQDIQYFYQDVIIMRIDKAGKLEWTKKLPKNQVGQQGKGGMSIKFMQGQDSDYVIYVDNPKNAELTLDMAPKQHKDRAGGYLTGFKINHASGEVQKHTIAFLEDISGIEAFQFNTSRIFNVMNKNFALEVYIKGKQDIMIKMEVLK